MKKTLALMLSAVLLVMLFAGCGSSAAPAVTEEKEEAPAAESSQAEEAAPEPETAPEPAERMSNGSMMNRPRSSLFQ